MCVSSSDCKGHHKLKKGWRWGLIFSWCLAGARLCLFWVIAGGSCSLCSSVFFYFSTSSLVFDRLNLLPVVHCNQGGKFWRMKRRKNMNPGKRNRWKERQEWKSFARRKPSGRRPGWIIPTSTLSCSSTTHSSHWWVAFSQKYFNHPNIFTTDISFEQGGINHLAPTFLLPGVGEKTRRALVVAKRGAGQSVVRTFGSRCWDSRINFCLLLHGQASFWEARLSLPG